jgi:hypothetical protein
MFKTMVVAGGLVFGALASGGAGQALADSNIDIGIGGYSESGPRYVRSGDISCRQGARIVRSAGFRGVRAADCEGRNYTYYGYRRDRMFQIEVRSRDGSIRNIKRLRGGGGGYGGGYDDGGYDDDYDDEY